MKVSVVTPFHNTATYLDECIRSVRAQTFADFEYVLLDNCSTDDSLEIARRHAAEDGRIRLLRNDQLLDQVANYNKGLAAISTQSLYCKLVQADDWIHRHCLEEMVALADSDPRIRLVSSYRMLGRMVTGTGLPHTDTVVDGREICRQQLLQGRFYFGSPTTVMYRSESVRSHDPFYESGRLHEDTEKCYELLEAGHFGFVHQVLSFSRTDNESIMARARRFNATGLDRLICIERFGPRYLSQQELAQLRKVQWRDYLRYLGEQRLVNRDPQFWDYHRRGLASIQRELPRTSIVGQAALQLVWRVANPGETLHRGYAALMRRLTRRGD